MSRTEYHSGRMERVQIPEGKNLTDFCRGKLFDEGITEMPTYMDSWIEVFRDHFGGYNKDRDEYVIVGESVFKMIEHKETDDEDYFMNLTENSDGTISFHGQFYNGGTCFSEMIEEAIEGLNK